MAYSMNNLNCNNSAELVFSDDCSDCPLFETNSIDETTTMSQRIDIVAQRPIAPKYTRLVLEGGGVLGVAYGGALAALHELGALKGITEYAASSVGSMAAGVLACGASFNFIKSKITDIDPKQFLDCSTYKTKNLYDLVVNYGLCPGDAMLTWYEDVIYQLTGNSQITLGEINNRYGSKVYLTGTSVTRRTCTYFGPNNYSSMPLARAVRISAALPAVFTPVEHAGQLWADGGILDNFPIRAFDVAAEAPIDHSDTLGLMLMTQRELTDDYPAVNNIVDYISALVGTFIGSTQKTYIDETVWKNTIKINVGKVSSVDFNISQETKTELVSKGYTAVKEFFKV
jgi:NTE family protein